MIEIVLATRNPKKKRELEEILQSYAGPISLYTLADFAAVDEVIEDGASFLENAQKKALAIARQTKHWALADDSGLSVDALGGEPGIFSARYAGEPCNQARNNEKLLDKLQGVKPQMRTAYFTCALALADPNGQIRICVEEHCHGLILDKLRGDKGFGYDPLFLYPPKQKTFAQLDPAEKNQVSHRARALQSFVRELKKLSDSLD